MTDLVIDASVAIRWVVDEPETGEALSLRRQNRLFAPDLLIPECAIVLRRKFHLGELTSEEALFAARLLQLAKIELLPMRALLGQATSLAVALDHSAYDCIYLALAEQLSCDLVTADEGFRAKAATAGSPATVLPLIG